MSFIHVIPFNSCLSPVHITASDGHVLIPSMLTPQGRIATLAVLSIDRLADTVDYHLTAG